MNKDKELTIEHAKSLLKEVKSIDKEILHGLYCNKNTKKGVFLISKSRMAFISMNSEGKSEIEQMNLQVVKSVEFYFGDNEGKLDILFEHETKVFSYGLQNIRDFQKTVEEIFEEILSIRELKKKEDISPTKINTGELNKITGTGGLKPTDYKPIKEEEPKKEILTIKLIIGIFITLVLIMAIMLGFFFKKELFALLKNKNQICKIEINSISSKLKEFYFKNDKYPENIFSNPAVLKEFAKAWNGPEKDPWNNPYRISPLSGQKGYIIYSNGADKTPGTDDDIMEEFFIK